MAKPSITKKSSQVGYNLLHTQSHAPIIKTISLDASKTLDSKYNERDVSEFRSSEEKRGKVQNKRQKSKSMIKEDGKVKGKPGRKPKSTNVADADGKLKRKLTKVKDMPADVTKDYDLISDDEQDKKAVDVISNSFKIVKEAVDVSPEDERRDVAEHVEEEMRNNVKLSKETKSKKVQHVDLEEKPVANNSRISKPKLDHPASQKLAPGRKSSLARRGKEGIQCENIGDVDEAPQMDNANKTKNGPAKAFARKTEPKVAEVTNRTKKSVSGSENFRQFELNDLVELTEAPKTQKADISEQDADDFAAGPKKKRAPTKVAEKQAKISMEPVKAKSSVSLQEKKKQATVHDLSGTSEKEDSDCKPGIITALALVFKVEEDEILTLMEKYSENDKRVRDHLIARQLNQLLDGDKIVN